MSTERLTTEALALPVNARVTLAQALWESINEGLPVGNEAAAINEALARDHELSAGSIKGRSHADVMRTAKKAIGCS